MHLLITKHYKLLVLFLLLIFEPTVHAAGGSSFTTAFWKKKKDSQWIKTLGGTDFDSTRQVGVDSVGNVYVAGKFFNDSVNTNLVTDFKNTTLTARGDANAFVAKLDKDGNQTWIKTFGGTQADEAYNIKVDASGNVYVVGYYDNNASNGASVLDFNGANFAGIGVSVTRDIFVAKLDTNGNQLWIKKLGGSNTEQYPVLAIDSSGNVYVSGQFYNSSTNSQGVLDFSGAFLNGKTSTASSDVFIAKLNTSGVQQWINILGGKNSESTGMTWVDASGNVFVSGSYYNDPANSQGVLDFAGNALNGISSSGSLSTYSFIAKLNPSGVQVWIKTMGGESFDGIYGIADAGSGSIYVSGFYDNNTANVQAMKDFAGATLLGKTTTSSWDAYIAKLDVNGNQLWIKTMGGTSSDSIYGLVSDASYNIYACGGFFNTAADANAFKDFTGTTRLGVGGGDIHVVKLNSSGTQEWFDSMGGTSGESCYGLAFMNGTLYVPGNYSNNAANVNAVKDLWGNNLPGKTTTTSTDIFILKYVP